MGRGSDQATNAATTAANTSAALEGNAGNLYSGLVPQLQAEAAHPSGIAPTDLAAMKTGAMETAGGSEAGAVGQGALLAARTRNAGGADAAIQGSTRDAGRNLSRANLGIDTANAEMKEHQRQAGLGGLEHLYSENLGTGVQSLGQVAPDVNASVNQENASWDWSKDLLAPILEASSKAGAAALGGCWIAEAIYGIEDPRTALSRAWLNGPFLQTSIGPAVMWLYLRIGRAVASVVRKSGILRSILKPLFDVAVRRACE